MNANNVRPANVREALAVLKGRERRKVANNTYLERRGPDTVALRLHNTDIITYSKRGITLNSGGWRTATTKARLNDFLPAGWYIHQEKGVWEVWRGHDNVAPFADGMTIGPRGGIRGAGRRDEPERVARLKKQAREYSKGFVEALAAGEVPPPSGGDCWGCAMTTDKGETPMGGPDHMREHMKEQYYVPSLLVRAFERFGASIAMRQWVAGLWGLTTTEYIMGVDFIRKQTERMIYRHVLRELGVAA